MQHVSDKGPAYAEVVRRAKADFRRVAEQRMDTSRFPAGLIFWAKNTIGFRDRSPAEVKEAADWLDALTARAPERSSSDRADAPPLPDNVLQLVDAEDVAQGDFPLDEPKQSTS